MEEGLRSSQVFSTIWRPAAAAMRVWALSTAGMEEAPGRTRPRVSARAVRVEAVPMVMQWPGERAMPSSISHHSSQLRLPARFSSQYFQTSEPEPRVVPRQLPFIMGPQGM